MKKVILLLLLTLIIMLSSCSSKEEDVILDIFPERWDSLELKTDFVDEIAILRIVEVMETDYYEGDADNFDTSPITKYKVEVLHSIKGTTTITEIEDFFIFAGYAKDSRKIISKCGVEVIPQEDDIFLFYGFRREEHLTEYDDRHIIGGLYNHATPQQIHFLDNYDSSLDFYSQNKDIQSMVAEITTILENLENKEE